VTKINIIWLPFLLLLLVGGFIVFKTSTPLEAILVYGKFYFLSRYLIYTAIGVAILLVMSKLDVIWFDRIGAGVLALSIMAVILMWFVPWTNENRVFFKIGGFSIRPSLYFTLGAIWLFDYSAREQNKMVKWMLWSIITITLCVWLLMVKFDFSIVILIALSVIGMIMYMYGFSRIFFLFFSGITTALALVALGSPHRMNRIQSWWEMLINAEPLTHPTGIDLMIDRMHEGLFAYNEWGGMALVVVTLLFVWLIVNIWKIESLFAKGVAMVLTVDILFHIINFFGLSLFKPPVLFMVEYGESITFVSFLMMGMVVMSSKREKGGLKYENQ